MSQIENGVDKEDCLDIVSFFNLLVAYKKKIAGVILSFMVVGCLYTMLSPRLFLSETSFFVTSSSSGVKVDSPYSSLLGVGSNSNIEAYIKSILTSSSIKKKIAKEYQSFFKEEIAEKINKKKLKNDEKYITNFVINKLNLHKAFTFFVTKDGLFKLSFYSENDQLSQAVLNSYIENILIYNRDLELSYEKNIIKVVDLPSTPLAPFKPNLKFNLILSLFMGSFVSVLGVLLKYYIDETK